jgi:short-chain fatty acids transporter
MLVKLGDRLTALFRATAPDPFVLAVALTLATFALAWGIVGARPSALLDAWAVGLWQPKLLAFAFQMCLVLVTGHALASAPVVARLITALAGVPRTGRQAVAFTALVSILAGLVNWGLGLVVGSILARDVGRSMRVRGVATP